MAFVLHSKIKIGVYTFYGGVNDLNIKKSVHVIVDTATLKIPGLGRVVRNGQPDVPPSSVETARLFKEGDPVAIDLGYNGDLRNEFRGFVRRVNITTPLSIEMEGYAWQLRNQNILASWKATTVKAVLTRIIQGTDIVLSPDIPDIALTNYHITNDNGLNALEDFKNRQLLTVYFDDNVLYVGLEETRNTAPGGGLAEVKYNIGYNCISNQPNLKQRLGKDNLIRVRLKTRGKDGKHTLYETGDQSGSIYETTIPFSTDANYLKNTADAKLKSLKYDG